MSELKTENSDLRNKKLPPLYKINTVVQRRTFNSSVIQGGFNTGPVSVLHDVFVFNIKIKAKLARLTSPSTAIIVIYHAFIMRA